LPTEITETAAQKGRSERKRREVKLVAERKSGRFAVRGVFTKKRRFRIWGAQGFSLEEGASKKGGSKMAKRRQRITKRMQEEEDN